MRATGLRDLSCGLLLAAAVVLTALAGCKAKPAPVASKPPVAAPTMDVEEIGWMKLDAGPRPPAATSKTPPAELPDLYRRRYRVKPDRRFLYAFGEVDRLLSRRKKPATLFLRFEGDRWSLRLENEAVGTLPEIPTFADGQRLLDEWARARVAKHGKALAAQPVPEIAALEADLTTGSTPRVLAALRELNRLANGSVANTEITKAATRGSVWLAAQAFDELQLSDPLMGHALALLALARVGHPGCLPVEEALLAALMGYEAAAMDVSRGLPSDSAVAAFVNLDTERLQKIVARPDPRAEYLYLLDLARHGQPEKWWAAFRKSVWCREASLSSLRAVAGLQDFNTAREAAQAVMAAAFLDAMASPSPSNQTTGLWGPEAWPHPALPSVVAETREGSEGAPEGRTRAFEASVSRLAAAADGPALDAESLRAFYRAAFYSGVHDTARFYFDSYGSTEAAERYAKTLDKPAPGTAEELRLWMDNRVVVRKGGGREASVRDFPRLRHIGVTPLYRAFWFLASTDSGTDPVRRRLLRVMVPALDTRPANLEYLLYIARSTLIDPRLHEKYLRVLGATAPLTKDAGLRSAYLFGDVDALRRMADDRRQGMGIRTGAVRNLRTFGAITVAEARARYVAFMKEEPEDLTPLELCVSMLRDAKEYAAASQIARQWLKDRPSKEEDLRWARAIVLQAEILTDQKKWKEAWKVIEPAMSTGKGDALLDGAWIQEEMGDWDSALDTARDALKRYPESVSGHAAVARVLWRQGKNAEAADFLATSRQLRRSDWEGEIANAFGFVFFEADPHQAENAFVALRDRKLDPNYLAALAKDLGARGNHKLAFAFLQQVPSTPSASAGASFGSAVAIWAHDELVKTDGQEAAADWLRKNTKIPHQLAIVAYQFGRYDILWEPLEDPARAMKNDEIQLLRTAALLMQRSEDGDKRAQIARYFEGRPRKEWAVMGLFLLGKASEAELFAGTTDPSHRTNASWLMGVKAAGDGHYEDASDWFSVAVDMDQNLTPPNAFAYMTLRGWMDRGKALSELAAEKNVQPKSGS